MQLTNVAAAAGTVRAPLGLQAGDRARIEFRAREEAPISLPALARRRAVSRQHIHQALSRLPDPSWVDETPDPEDGRAVRLRLRGVDAGFFAAIAPARDARDIGAVLRAIGSLRHRLAILRQEEHR